ncbi:DUF6580 family putative transport protein [Mucilaginibacter ginkgonis]|uniref:Uncharacterized protein n=1 Tax=Mucilaginibacter ginkgonis TaxID=2682091 RepID=A0A6I4HXJ2_9SPHI|nr:DUF6580 family putative transport protein [Mucilaginibacter ginkgonis]QQL51432.1 hypothetical protein GO620_008315 [Mucilaginibacter ginkgonis]
MSSQQKIQVRNLVLILMIVAAAAMRLVSFKYQQLSNFTPVGAIAIFGGTYFTDKWKAYLVPLITLFVSDIIINYLYFHKLILWTSYAPFVYGSFLAMVFFGTLIKKVNVVNVILASVGGVLIHWLLTDIHPWLNGPEYSKGIMGYFHSLWNAIPFEKNMLLGDLIYGTILFGAFELAKSKYIFLRTKRDLALA